MGRRATVLALTLLLSAAALGARKARNVTLRDGFALGGVEGRLILADSNDVWQFEFAAELGDDKVKLKAGKSLEILPSSALEKATSGAKTAAGGEYRLWGRLTKYQGKNYIYPIYFLPVRSVKRDAAPEPKGDAGKKAIESDPNDPLSLPPEIMKRLKARKIIRTEQLAKRPKLEYDSILADRTGFLARKNEGRYPFEFEFDAIGRNIQRLSIEMLPCQTLELVVDKQGRSLEVVRFRLAAVVTRYKDKYYLLPQRAVPVYSHGNFPR